MDKTGRLMCYTKFIVFLKGSLGLDLVVDVLIKTVSLAITKVFQVY